MKIKQLLLFIIISVFVYTGNASAQNTGSFQAGKNTFLLNGKPFVIKAAELHYSRIPATYWQNRIQLCKALGMNTICLYVFWNYHEQKPDQFDFKGNKDIREFCKLAQKEGMYVILRPGPYVCAEWEMGGLPWWLLKNDSIQLRTCDAQYLERVGKFMNEVGKQLSDMQISRGGNIIMVQVENEYGSYGVDKNYVSAIRDMVKKSGFDQVQLFQCDWSSNFTLNALDDLLWTVNFGTGSDIDKEFEKLKSLRPETPLMCSEFWSGWFDHWGRKHETRPAEAMVAGLKEMLDNNISFSLYMTHGGTTFGHWGGANNPAFSAMCSSYDYDAPISESGQITPKYLKLRELLSHYLPQGESLPAIPQTIKSAALPEIKFTQKCDIFSNLPSPVFSHNIQSMEKFDQGWGAICYSFTLKNDVKEGSVLNINEIHDFARVFAGDKEIANLDRRKSQFSCILPDLKQGTMINIFVEAMGRVNFDKSIHDRKGITKSVDIDGTEQKDFLVYNFPPDYDFVKNHTFSKFTSIAPLPAYYKAVFTVNKPVDTFIDMSSWGKGTVWINGIELGRFWNIGPQQTLYLPGCFLKEGLNEIIVMDILGPKKASIRGLKKPILDKLNVDVVPTHRKQSENIDLKNISPVFEGKLNNVNGPQTVNFKNNVSGRFVCLEALNNFEGTNIESVAEIFLLDADGKEINREKWKIRYADSEETRSGEYTADKVFDLQESTYWQTVDNTAFPHQIVIDLSKTTEISGLKIISRAGKGNPGLIENFRVFVSKDDFKY